MKETTHLFGAHRHLLGTLTTPDAMASSTSSSLAQPSHLPDAKPRPACLLMSAGVIHRTGPHRINVKLARALAEQGIASLRVDLAAVGDSRTPPTDEPYDRQAVIDLRASIDLLNEHNSTKDICVIGICSGAVYGLQTALLDERIVGLYLIDGYAYPTPRSRRERYLQRALTLTPTSLSQSLRHRLSARGNPEAPPVSAPDYGLSRPPIEDFVRDLRKLLARGVSIRQLFTGSILQFYNYDKQFTDAFTDYPDVQAIPSEYRPDIDHTMTALASQQALIDKVRAWQQDLHESAGQAA